MKILDGNMLVKAQVWLFVLVGLLGFSSCGEEGDSEVIEISVAPFSVTIEENPAPGEILGSISASTNGGAALSYSLLTGEDATAFNLDASSGELTVADASLFDFELNSALSATFEVSNDLETKQSTITVTLNDVDETSGGLVTSSTDFSIRMHHELVAFNDKMWVIGGTGPSGNNDEVWNSIDGVTWTNVQATGVFGHFSPRRGHSATVFNGKLWVIGGRDNTTRFADIWSSPDGVNWFQDVFSAPFGPTTDHTTLVYDNRIWVIGGTRGSNGVVKNDVWSSADGITWREEIGFATFTSRYNHAAVVFDDKMWIVGGEGNAKRADKVWNSVDGITWDEVTVNTEFSVSASHTLEVFDGKMWRIGGRDENDVINNEVWSTSDGITWSLETSPTGLSGRNGHSSVVYDDKIWLVGGWDGSAHTNDVWVIKEADPK